MASPAIDGFKLVASQPYADEGYPHEEWAELRRESPVHRCRPADFPPYWAITKHADICEVSKQPDKFLSQPGIVLPDLEALAAIERDGGAFDQMQTIITMDPPRHRKFRKVASPYFTPRALGGLDAIVEESAETLVRELVERAGTDGVGECDFVTDVAARHPLRILSTILGVPREDEPFILRVTNQLFGGDDPEFQREEGSGGDAFRALALEFFQYFAKIAKSRRESPKDDLAGILANAQIDGEPMGDVETFGYYLITFTAGHETTRNALSGGLHALIENPGEREKLRRDPEGLVASAVEEIVRWTTPVNYMMRTAAYDTELRDQKIAEGDRLILFYASANRDEDVFDEPFAFRIDRTPNPHLGFGIGEHFCLGSHLARKSQRALFGKLIPRLEEVELSGPPERLASSFVAGVKHLPIRYRIAR
jgi:cytochrome P450